MLFRSDYCYETGDDHKYRSCSYFVYMDGIEGYCDLCGCDVLDQVKECIIGLPDECLFNGVDKTVATGIACPCEGCSPR